MKDLVIVSSVVHVTSVNSAFLLETHGISEPSLTMLKNSNIFQMYFI